MIISKEKPAIFEKIVEVFDVEWKDIIITYGTTIHTQCKLTQDLLVHESIHIEQQKKFSGGPSAWWDRYLADKDFRLSQELEAYKAQYYFLKQQVKDRNKLAKYRWAIACHLSGSMYGRMIPMTKALNLIK